MLVRHVPAVHRVLEAFEQIFSDAVARLIPKCLTSGAESSAAGDACCQVCKGCYDKGSFTPAGVGNFELVILEHT